MMSIKIIVIITVADGDRNLKRQKYVIIHKILLHYWTLYEERRGSPFIN